MKTDPRRDSAASLSRRAFVVGAGSAVAASTVGSPAGAADSTVSVEATTPYRSAVSEVGRTLDESAGDAPLEIREADGDPTDRVRDGATHLSVSGRPVSGRTEDDAVDVVRGVAVRGWATLATRSDEWRACLSGSSLRETLGDDSPVEAWSETDWESVETLRAEAADDEAGRCVGRTATEEDRTHLVRGPRAYQYARGHGGVAHYEVPAATVGAPSATRRRGDDVVPLLRLAYVHVHADALDRATVTEFLRRYRRHSPALDDLALHAGAGANDVSALVTD